ncbi:MAG: hypoxanthine-guanine phosphoribosyltransferase [Candidatus Accumulibacter sp.]|jgi:hypoxanthine phosphoribosyltransferase|nr:hypoxanthine-guanine phosphoribosyltransferase [Accumulibacter sp.]
MTRIQTTKDFLARAERLYTEDTVDAAVRRVAGEITEKLGDTYPLLVCVMNGGIVFAGDLMKRLNFPLDFDYLHVTRYGEEKISGGSLHWRAMPRTPVEGRVILVVDDILDEGVTLAAIVEHLNGLGAAACYTAVAVDKLREKNFKADFTALTVPDRFVFGYGMDAYGLWRNLHAIYAMKEE